MRVLRGMNEGHDAAGAALGAKATFHIGAALNLNMEDEQVDFVRERARRKLHDDDTASGELAENGGSASMTIPLTETELELRRLRRKLDAGAQYIMTQPIYDIEPLERFSAAFGPVGVPMLLGMIPLHSSKHAEYLHNEVPGITIPAEVRARMPHADAHAPQLRTDLARDVFTPPP